MSINSTSISALYTSKVGHTLLIPHILYVIDIIIDNNGAASVISNNVIEAIARLSCTMARRGQ